MTALVVRWRARLVVRKVLLAVARRRVAYWQRRLKATHRGSFGRARAEAMLKQREELVRHRLAQVAEAQRVIKRHSRIKRISNAGVELVKRFEGFRSEPYQDPAGVWTIGYGHTHGIGSHTTPISEPQAARLLRHDLDAKYAPHVARLRLPLSQHQFDALVSFVYNVGPGGIASSTRVGAALRRRHWQQAADHLLDWNKAGGRVLPGLTARRHAERTLFLEGSR